MRTRNPGDTERFSASFTCDECSTLSIAELVHPIVGVGRLSSEAALEKLNKEKVRWFPAKAMGTEFDDVPDPIASAAKETTEALSMGLNRSAALLARSVVEATAKDKGATEGNLYAKIEKLCDMGLIRSHTRDGAHEIRHLGNDMAHGDFVKDIPPADAELVVTLMAEILDEVYQGPARVEKAKAARAARRDED